MIVMLADLIPHGSQQVSHWVSFIGPEPPQVWGAHGGGGGRKKTKKKNQSITGLLSCTDVKHACRATRVRLCVQTCLQRHGDVHPPVGSDD